MLSLVHRWNPLKPLNYLSPVWQTTLLLFALMCGNKLGFILSGGEEQYLAFAKQFMNPDWIPNSFTLSEFPGSRLLYQILVGGALSIFGFEEVVFFGRLMVYLLMSHALALIVHHLQLSRLAVLLTMQVFIMSPQSFLGGEWIIGGIEPKAFAYLCVFYAWYFTLKRQLVVGAVLFSLATYFHLLAGGWSALLLFLLLLWDGHLWRDRKLWLIYAVLTLPLIGYLASGYFLQPSFESAYDLGWVYAYFRLPHHLGIFSSTAYFMKTHFQGVLTTIVALVVIFLYKKHAHQAMRKMIIIGTAINLIFVVFALADATMLSFQGSGLLKIYPFRLNSIVMLLTLFISIDWLIQKSIQIPYRQYFQRSFILILLVLAVAQLVNNVTRQVAFSLPDGFVATCDFIKTDTPPGSTFAWINLGCSSCENSFARRAERDPFFVFKFVPAESKKLDAWYTRANILYDWSQNPDEIPSSLSEYKVDYLLTKKEMPNLQLAFSSGAFYLYQL